MTLLIGPQDSANFSQANWQEMMSPLFTTGVMNGQLGGYITTVTSGLGISVASGKAMIQGFYARSDAAVPLTAGAADPTNPRIDLVVLHADLTAHTLGVLLLAGTPAPTPSPPALTQTSTVWEIGICQVRVNALQTTLTGGSLSDVRQFSGFGGVGIDYLASINAAQLWTPQSGVANWLEFISWSASLVEVPLGVGSGALAAALAKTIIGGAGQFQQVAGQATAGSYGVPVVIGSASDTAVTSTTAVNICTATTPNDGKNHLVRFCGAVSVGAGASNNGVCNFSFAYSDPNIGSSSTVAPAWNGNSVVVFSGLVVGKGGLGASTLPTEFLCAPNTTVKISYQNTAAGTISDKISGTIELLS